jgi:uncharacterized membrane protein YozB (DUF420 family)
VNESFLHTAASRYADLILLAELGMGLALLLGAFLARIQKFRAHAACQSAVVALNLFAIVFFMLPSFRGKVAPRIPAKLGKSYYWLATTHATLGSATEITALYILLAAGTNFLPERFRLKRYKFWMRTLLIAWWLVLLLGFATYVRWYIPHFVLR